MLLIKGKNMNQNRETTATSDFQNIKSLNPGTDALRNVGEIVEILDKASEPGFRLGFQEKNLKFDANGLIIEKTHRTRIYERF
jgi:hypothetical protein